MSRFLLIFSTLLLSSTFLACGSSQRRDSGDDDSAGDDDDSAGDDDDSAGDDDDSAGDDDDSGTDDDDAALPTEVERILLHEMFTGSNAGPCTEADENLLAILDSRPGRFAPIFFHVGNDPYMSDESVARVMYYRPDKTFYSIPYLHVDGANHLHPTQDNDGLGYTAELFDGFAIPSSPLRLEVTHTLNSQTVDFSVQITALADLSSSHLVLHAAIIEGTTYNNVGNNEQTEFRHVMKKMVPDEGGTPLGALLRGDEFEFDMSWAFQGDYAPDTGPSNMVDHDLEHTVEEFDDLSVVVWVQDVVSWEVHQSGWSLLN